MSLSQQFLDELRARTTLSALVGRSTKIVKKGSEYAGCCPFHNEKTASFYVNDDKAFYHCFGCSAHGDAIKWLTDTKGLDFMDAVRELAAAAGMEVPRSTPGAQREADERAPLLDALERAARLYASGRDARAPAMYMDRRGITPALADTFQIGFAPDSRTFLGKNLHGTSQAAMIDAGLLKQPEGGGDPYDRFRGRLMFPIHDKRGRVIGFGGRILGDGEPKYLNSPETLVFDKGRTLFNLHRAAPVAKRSNRLIVVEGYMDVIGLARVGIEDVVAPNGTAVTEAQIAAMWHLSPEPVMMLDGDKAGARAMVKAALRALPGLEPDRSLRFATLPAGKDPDDVARDGGAAAIEAAISAAIGLADVLWRHESAQGRLDTPEGRAGLRQRLADHAAAIQHGGVRELYRDEWKRRFDAQFAAPARETGKGWQSQPFSRQQANGRRRPPERPVSDAARDVAKIGVEHQVRLAILLGCLRMPEVAAAQYEALAQLKLPGRYGELVDVLCDTAIAGSIDAAGIAAMLETHRMQGAPADLAARVRLPFSFLAPNPGDDAREALIDALIAETQ